MAEPPLHYQNIFFIGIAGTGMSALAQYLRGIGKNVAGSDRYFSPDAENETQKLLEKDGIRCFPQDASGLSSDTDLVVVSTAIEDTVEEVRLARKRGIRIIRRSELLAEISKTKKTVAIAGTSGKSTTCAMLFQILSDAGLQPSIISGAGLTALIKKGKIGNAEVGAGEILVIEADESDGSVTQYEPHTGVLLNVDKDHQEIDELLHLFSVFKRKTTDLFIVNGSNVLAKTLSEDTAHDFGFEENSVGYSAENFSQNGFSLSFTIKDQLFKMQSLGRHSVENAAAAVAVAHQLGVPLSVCAASLAGYEGIYRRHQVLGEKNGVWVIDDYAHNPAKCAASIAACQPVGKKVVAWFQPHGYGPTRFLKNDFIAEISAILRPQDEIWMSEIFYAGGSAVKDISARDLTDGIAANGKNANFVQDRADLLAEIRPHLQPGTVLLLMGARDPALEAFCKDLYHNL